MDPNDSIDGLGLTVADLNEAGWRKALVRVMHRTEEAARMAAIDAETRTTVASKLTSAKGKFDAAEAKLSEATTPKSRSKP